MVQRPAAASKAEGLPYGAVQIRPGFLYYSGKGLLFANFMDIRKLHVRRELAISGFMFPTDQAGHL